MCSEDTGTLALTWQWLLCHRFWARWAGRTPVGNISALSLVLSVSFQAVASTMDFLWICLILLAVVLPEGSLADLEKQRMGSGLEICILSRSAMPLSRSHLRRSGNTCM